MKDNLIRMDMQVRCNRHLQFSRFLTYMCTLYRMVLYSGVGGGEHGLTHLRRVRDRKREQPHFRFYLWWCCLQSFIGASYMLHLDVHAYTPKLLPQSGPQPGTVIPK